MKTLLLLVAAFNLNTIDTHSIEYNPNPIQYNGLTYQVEEDYSVSINYVPYHIVKNGFKYLVNEDLSLTLIK